MARANIELEEVLADAASAFRRARATGWLADLGVAEGVLRHDDVRELFADPRLRTNFAELHSRTKIGKAAKNKLG